MVKKFNQWGSSSNTWDKPTNTPNLSSWQGLPWAQLGKSCSTASTTAVDTANADNLGRYKEFITKKEKELSDLNPEAGSYEGNLSEQYPYKPLGFNQLQYIREQASTDIVKMFCESNNLVALSSKLMPMLTTYLAMHSLTDMDGEAYDSRKAEASLASDNINGLISGKSLYLQVFSNDTGLGLYRFLMHNTRSDYLESPQYKGASKNFSSLVPLIMYPFKLIKGIPYSHWYKEEIPGIVNPKLAVAMLWDEEANPKPSNEVILLARENGLKVKSGAKAGTMRNPISCHKLYGATTLSNIPEYVQAMYSQIWLAHPENRTKYMILTPSNWDKMPEPLISSTKVLQDSAPMYVPHKDTADWF